MTCRMDADFRPPVDGQAVFAAMVAAKVANGDSGADVFEGRLRVCERGNGVGGGVDGWVLGGGLDRGVLCGVSAGVEEGRVFSLSLITTTLLSSPTARITVIDSTGSFPLLQLSHTLHHRIRHDREYERNMAREKTLWYRRETGTGEEEEARIVETLAGKCLERVGVARVFDLEGLWEVVGEVGRGDGEDADGDGAGNGSENDQRVDDPVVSRQNSPDWPENEEAGAEAEYRPVELEIMDSQDEDEDSNLSSSPIGLEPKVHEDPDVSQGVNRSSRNRPASIPQTPLVVVDTMTTLINELFSRVERNTAHNLLTTLTRTLRTLCRTQLLTILLLNGLTSTNRTMAPASTMRQPDGNHGQYNHLTTHPKAGTASIFTSTILRPSLGQLFNQIPDLHLMVTPVPRSRNDAEILFSTLNFEAPAAEGEEETTAQETESAKKRRKLAGEMSYTNVIEVLKDTCPLYPNNGADKNIVLTAEQAWDRLQKEKKAGNLARREQRWAAFDFVYNTEGGVGGPVVVGMRDAFGDGKTMPGMGQVKGRLDVGSIAKMYGFGGRRV